MRKIIIFIFAITFFASCSLIKDTAYSITIYNKSSADILVEYETATKKESVVIINTNSPEYYVELHGEFHAGKKNLEKYTKEEFESIVHSVKLSIVNGTDTIPLSKEFAPFENWQYWDHYDDFIMEYEYFLKITDDMLD
jgi:thioredoxin-related protein